MFTVSSYFLLEVRKRWDAVDAAAMPNEPRTTNLVDDERLWGCSPIWIHDRMSSSLVKEKASSACDEDFGKSVWDSTIHRLM